MFRWKNRKGATPSSVGHEPRRRRLRTPDDAEVAAAEWLRHWGFRDVEAFPGGGPDGGVDLRGSGIVGQVKATRTPVGRPVVQQIFGIAAAEGATAVVFSLSGYSSEAVGWADRTGVMLFVFDLQGRPSAANWAASRLREPTVSGQLLSHDVRADVNSLVQLSGEIIEACQAVLSEVQDSLEDDRGRLADSTFSTLSELGIDPGLLADLEATLPEPSADAELRTTREKAELDQAIDNWKPLMARANDVLGRLVDSSEAMEPSIRSLWFPHADLIREASRTMEKALLLPSIRRRMGW